MNIHLQSKRALRFDWIDRTTLWVRNENTSGYPFDLSIFTLNPLGKNLVSRCASINVKHRIYGGYMKMETYLGIGGSGLPKIKHI
jgi:hypothetical protein